MNSSPEKNNGILQLKTPLYAKEALDPRMLTLFPGGPVHPESWQLNIIVSYWPDFPGAPLNSAAHSAIAAAVPATGLKLPPKSCLEEFSLPTAEGFGALASCSEKWYRWTSPNTAISRPAVFAPAAIASQVFSVSDWYATPFGPSSRNPSTPKFFTKLIQVSTHHETNSSDS